MPTQPSRIEQAWGSNREPSLVSPGQAVPTKSRILRLGISSKVLLFPLFFFQAYLLASVLAFAFGPLEFSVQNPYVLYTYVLLGQLAIFFGYFLGISRPPRSYSGLFPVSLIRKTAIVVTLAILPFSLYFHNYDGASLLEVITNPGAAYMARIQDLMNRDSTSVISIMRALFGPVLGLFIPLGILYRKQMNFFWRSLWKIGLVGMLTQVVLGGAAKGLFDLVLVVPWMLWLYQQRTAKQALDSNRAQRPQVKVKRKGLLRKYPKNRRVLLVAATVLLFVVGIKYFSYSRQSRYGLTANEYPSQTIGWSEDLYGVAIPESIEYPVYMVTRYWTQGYFGLSECLQLPFEWSYGVGHSQFWMRYAGKLRKDPGDLWERCYPVRLESETGYEVAYYWHTIYPWLASDLTFPGALLFIGWMAFLLAQAWSDTLLGRNPFAAGFLGQILLMFFYIPANNIRLMFSEELMTFWGLLFLWLVTRKR